MRVRSCRRRSCCGVGHTDETGGDHGDRVDARSVARCSAALLLGLVACGPILSVPDVAADGTSGAGESSTALASSDATHGASATSAADPTGVTTADHDDSGGSSSSGDVAGDTTDFGDTSTSEGSTGEPAPLDPVAHYEVTITNTWTEVTHPGALPPLAHFSWLGGATHDDTITFWQLGELASPGIVQMAEIGNTDILSTEVAFAIEAGHADAALQWQQWFCAASTDVTVCGPSTVAFDVTVEFPRLTLVSMLGPSPDLFVGVSSLPLVVEGANGEAWVDEIVIDLVPYDGGTRSDLDFTMNGALQEPPQAIWKIASTDDHMIGPGSLGTMTIVRVAAPDG